ncbi:hypothetical protein [Streptomyces hydrogenans]|uniref:Uncharacterized protein n=1 Tax=Streptomyces hydrogenans TaxID=1873719 RepID=A0ABQ3PJF8_9ACTN|nr:hypothetical protein [Streptomyces hydrogenans]GHF94591.1 hypothetical protein GCM10018784_02820 [Streptomyces hydrogenans]GHI25156.1 hypothetical protein Shyd_65270 [Streptomyces hydrogenans]
MTVAFNDPSAWGYCQFCAFIVGVDLETRQMLAHERMISGFNKNRCYGSLMPPAVQPGPEAEPVTYEEVIADAIRGDE